MVHCGVGDAAKFHGWCSASEGARLKFTRGALRAVALGGFFRVVHRGAESSAPAENIVATLAPECTSRVF